MPVYIIVANRNELEIFYLKLDRNKNVLSLGLLFLLDFTVVPPRPPANFRPTTVFALERTREHRTRTARKKHALPATTWPARKQARGRTASKACMATSLLALLHPCTNKQAQAGPLRTKATRSSLEAHAIRKMTDNTTGHVSSQGPLEYLF